LGFRLISSTLTAGSGVQSGGGWVLTGTLSLSGFAGQSVAGETVLIPGTQ
jgi:hypothetical protein